MKTESILECADVQALLNSYSEDIVLIDTRSPEAYLAGHLPGARNLREIFTYLATTDYDGLESLTSKFSDLLGKLGVHANQKIVFYEQQMNDGFGQSCRGWYLMQYLGHSNAAVLHGGYQRWLREGLPSTIDIPNLIPVQNFKVLKNENVMVTKDQMLEALNDKETIILDVRDVSEWIGESSSPYGIDYCPRKGRIPGARWIEWYRFMKPGEYGSIFKNKNELLAELQTADIDSNSNVIIYCFKGARAANALLAMKSAGIDDVRMYFGSWNEWSRDPLLPIE
jgi:thiosulfate/3-mercaptopyruvate sulfurtransferase